MAALGPELLVLSDAGRFRADNLLGAEDWDAALYGCLDDRLEPAHLFPSLDPDPMFDCAFEGDEAASPPDPPWDQEPPSLFPDLQVKSEPGSPTSSHCSDSSGLSSASEAPPWAPSPPEPGVKTEPPPPLPCAPPDTAGKGPRAVKAEGPPPPPPSRRTPPIQPKPPGGAAVGPGGAAPSPPQTILLQPLPGAAPPLPGAIAVPAPAVLLSPAELLLPGVLCLPPPAGPPPAPPPPHHRPAPPGPPKSEAKTIVPAPAPPPAGPQEVDAQALKRQQRMIKNRESACQSRRRRKEYVQGLEERLRQALADNDRLRRENALLRRRLDALLTQMPEPRPGPRTLACLAALLLFLAFNLGPRSFSQPPPAQPPPPPRGRRHLLGVAEGGGGDGGGGRGGGGGPVPHVPPLPRTWGPPPGPQQETPDPPGGSRFSNASVAALTLRELDGLFRGSDCRRFNRTESLRLADELSGWVRRHQIDRRKPAPPPPPPRHQASPPRKAPSSSSSSSPRLPPAAPPRTERPPPGQLQLYRGPDRPEPHFLAAIDRREDTFYVVSFRRDHLLLPAISHNKTSRPKMSLVMPAAALNESVPGGGGGLEAMMQVDCEVMDTRVIHVRRRRDPPRPPPPPTAPAAPPPSAPGHAPCAATPRPPRSKPPLPPPWTSPQATPPSANRPRPSIAPRPRPPAHRPRPRGGLGEAKPRPPLKPRPLSRSQGEGGVVGGAPSPKPRPLNEAPPPRR